MNAAKDKIGYDAEEYSGVKNHGWRVWVETHTIWEMFRRVTDLKGKTVLDAGCGTGLHARHMVEYLGAKKVIAVDGDAKFIEQAKKESAGFGNAIEFRKSWIQHTRGKENCDAGLASYLMSYPQNAEQAKSFTKGLARYLKDGAPVVGFSNNHRQRAGGLQYEKYGFIKRHARKDFDGAPVQWRIRGLSDPITNHNLKEKTYKNAFAEAGMGVAYQKVLLNPSQEQNPHWKTFLKDEPPVIAWVAIKGATHEEVRNLLAKASV